MKSPLVSIVIPAYNAASLIGEALESVRQQTYSYWEVLLVEDGIQDGTEEILRDFGSTVQQRTKYIRHDFNRGVSETRNTAISAASGEYIALLDHDDIWEVNHLKLLTRKLQETQADLVFSSAYFFDSLTKYSRGLHGPHKKELDLFPQSLLNRCYVPVSSVVMKRDVPDLVGGFDPNLSKAEDLDYWLRCLEAGLSFEFVSQVTNGYRQSNPKAATSDKQKILEGHAIVLRKHSKACLAPKIMQGKILARYHLGVARRNARVDLEKARSFLLWSIRLAPLGSLLALVWFVLEAIKLSSRYTEE